MSDIKERARKLTHLFPIHRQVEIDQQCIRELLAEIERLEGERKETARRCADIAQSKRGVHGCTVAEEIAEAIRNEYGL